MEILPFGTTNTDRKHIMIDDITLTAKPTALQIPEDIDSDPEKRAEFLVQLGAFGATGISYMSGDEFAIPHITWYDWEGNPSAGFLGEYLVKYDDFPEIQVYSEDRFFRLFAVAETSSGCLAGC